MNLSFMPRLLPVRFRNSLGQFALLFRDGISFLFVPAVPFSAVRTPVELPLRRSAKGSFCCIY